MTENEAIKQLKEVYRDTIISLSLEESKERLQAISLAISCLQEIQKYHEIGTVEECREAMEKQKAKKPLEYESHKDYDDGLCPNCSEPVNSVFGYCTDCGQKLDWSNP